MNYIVLDLEWNRPEGVTDEDTPGFVFEIIEIGAVRIGSDGNVAGSFSELIRPQVYQSLNAVTGKLVHLDMEDLRKGKTFRDVMERFFAWCGEEEYLFCTWGPGDLTELQRNMEYYGLGTLKGGPVRFLDIQKIYSLIYEDDKKNKKTLEYAVEQLGIKKEIPFHRAYGDAYYTAQVFLREQIDGPDKMIYVSYDVYCPPAEQAAEIRVQFPTYAKYISRTFADKTELMKNRETVSTKCYLCHRNVKKKIRWFTTNHKNYYSLACCEKHGFLRGKIHILKTEDGRVFAVKTTRLITAEEAEKLRQKKEKAKLLMKKEKH